jgi:hypothetical protein
LVQFSNPIVRPPEKLSGREIFRNISALSQGKSQPREPIPNEKKSLPRLAKSPCRNLLAAGAKAAIVTRHFQQKHEVFAGGKLPYPCSAPRTTGKDNLPSGKRSYNIK